MEAFSEELPLPVAALLISPDKRSWPTTAYFASSAHGNIIKEEWLMIYGYMILLPKKIENITIILHRTFQAYVGRREDYFLSDRDRR